MDERFQELVDYVNETKIKKVMQIQKKAIKTKAITQKKIFLRPMIDLNPTNKIALIIKTIKKQH
jgi:hypothetical protein